MDDETYTVLNTSNYSEYSIMITEEDWSLNLQLTPELAVVTHGTLPDLDAFTRSFRYSMYPVAAIEAIYVLTKTLENERNS